jgi:hypothetical protein
VTAGDLVRRTIELGRMTREDATELAGVFLQVSSRQALDALTELERLLAALAKRLP